MPCGMSAHSYTAQPDNSYLLYRMRGPIEVGHARIVHSKLARDASDHLPLVVDFHLRAGTTGL